MNLSSSLVISSLGSSGPLVLECICRRISGTIRLNVKMIVRYPVPTAAHLQCLLIEKAIVKPCSCQSQIYNDKTGEESHSDYAGPPFPFDPVVLCSSCLRCSQGSGTLRVNMRVR